MANNSKNTIIARDKYIAKIHNEFDNVLAGSMGLNIITGKPGIGKTYLVKSMETLFSSNYATYIEYKFKQYDLNLFTDIIDQITKHYLMLSHNDFIRIEENLQENFNGNKEILMSICPHTVKLFGGREDKHEILNKNKIRKMKL